MPFATKYFLARLATAMFTAATFVGSVTSQELFRDAMTTGTAWQNLNTASIDSLVTHGYDYSADFIPEAPHSRPGDAASTGVKSESNLSVVNSGFGNEPSDIVALSPVVGTFTCNYRLRFDAWINFDSNAYYNLNRSGTSEIIGASIRADPTQFESHSTSLFSSFQTNAYAVMRGDGDIYPGRAGDDSEDTQYTSFAQDDPDYYGDFLPPVSPPVGQQVDHGPTAAGALGFQWLTFEFQAVDDVVLVIIEKTNGDRLPIFRIDESAAPSLGESFVLLYDDDWYPSIAGRPEMQFGLFDNVVVENLISGDFNADGFVNQSDLDLVLLNWGTDTTTVISDGWINTLGLTDLVSQNELDDVLLNWGNGIPPRVTIPEPTTLAVAGLVGLMGFPRRGR